MRDLNNSRAQLVSNSSDLEVARRNLDRQTALFEDARVRKAVERVAKFGGLFQSYLLPNEPLLLLAPATVLPSAPALPVKRRSVRWGRWVFLLLLLGAAAFFARMRFSGASSGEAHRYQTAPVVRRQLREVISASGTLNTIVSVTIGAEVNGVIRKVFVDYNSPVKAGQAVAQIDTLVYQANLTQAEATSPTRRPRSSWRKPTSSANRNSATKR